MKAQLFALLTALAFTCSNVTVKRGFRHSSPLTATFVSLLIHSVVLWIVVLASGGVPPVALAAVAAIVISGL